MHPVLGDLSSLPPATRLAILILDAAVAGSSVAVSQLAEEVTDEPEPRAPQRHTFSKISNEHE